MFSGVASSSFITANYIVLYYLLSLWTEQVQFLYNYALYETATRVGLHCAAW